MTPLLTKAPPAMRRGVMCPLGHQYQLRFERDLTQVPALIWRWVATPEGLAEWFPADVEWDFRVGGSIEFHMEVPAPKGMITAIDVAHTFAFLWGEELIRFEILEHGHGARLVFTHTLSKIDPAKYAAGWQVCLEHLESRLNDTPPPRPSRWQAAYELYTRDFNPES